MKPAQAILLALALGWLAACASRGLEGAAGLRFEEVLRRYRDYEPRKALALAMDQNGRWAYGASEALLTAGSAEKKALDQCRKTAAAVGVAAECRIYASGDQIAWEGPRPE